MDIKDIMNCLPHRYPFLLVDRITEIGENRIVGIKNVTVNEPFFQGHFPGHPIMPGVLIIEAMAQIGGVFAFKSMNATHETKVVYFMGIDSARFRKPVLPGDQIRFELELLKRKGPVWSFKGNAYVGDTLVAEAELLATIVDK